MSNILDELHDQAVKSVEKNSSVSLYRYKEAAKRIGMPDVLSTGYPSLDLHLLNKIDKWGFPYGRVSGIYGDRSALKTTFLLQLLARNVRKGGDHLNRKNGGISILLTNESDYDDQYLEKFLKKNGISDEELREVKYHCGPVSNMSDVDSVVSNYLKPYLKAAKKMEKKGKNPHEHLPRITIALDSIGSTPSESDLDRLTGDARGKSFSDGKQVGAKASSIHNFFQKHLIDFAKLGVMFVYANHYRDNIGFGNKKYKAAHESALKYYTTLRCEFKKGYVQGSKMHKEKSKNNVSYKKGWWWECNIKKIRQELTLAGKVQIPFYENIGLDRTHSIVDACNMSGIASLYASVYTIDEPEDNPLHEYNDSYEEKELRKKIATDVEFRKTLIDEIYKRGPINIQAGFKDKEFIMD